LWSKGPAHIAGFRGFGIGLKFSCKFSRNSGTFSRVGARTMSLPGAPFLRREGAELRLEGHSLAELGRQFGTPLYVYSRSAMLAAVADYKSALKGRKHLVCYAVKANSSLAVLQTFVQAGCGLDIVSGGELARALVAGADPGHNEVALAVDRRAAISLRVNPDVDAGTHPYISTGLKGNKFGIAHANAVAVYRRAASLLGLHVVGIDCHIGSQITQVAPYLDALDRLLDLVEAVEAAGVPIHHVDVGGGLGITYADEQPPAASLLVSKIVEKLDARGHGHRELLFEPGRSLVGNAGVLVTEVMVLKPGEVKNFCIVDAAMNDLMRPALYQAWMGIEPCVQRPGAAKVWDVVGPVCESGDWLGRDRSLALQAGDMLSVLSAGAYGMTMASNYNTRPRAAEVMVHGDQVHLIRERETVASLFANERLI
jgi:diaminopimelate decarboxylase